MSQIKKKKLLIVAILLIALAVRLWGIGYDLPYIYHPDEPWPIRIGHRMLVTRDFNPNFFDWPSLIIYVNLYIQSAYYFIANLFSFGTSPEIINPLVEVAMGVTYSPKPTIVLLGRLVTVFIGVGNVALTIWTGKKLSCDLKVGALAGLMMALSEPNVGLNRFITPDSYATFFVAVVLLASVLIFRKGRTRAYVIGGLGLGLAIASKYNSALVVIVLLVGHFLRTGWQGYKDYRLYLAFGLAGLAFVVANPYALLDFSAFYADFASTGQHYSKGHEGMEGDTLRWYLDYMWKTAGFIYILAALEILRGLYARSKEIILLSVFPIVYFAFISSFVVRNDRTLLPLTTFAFLLAASFFIYVLNITKRLQSRRLRRLSTFAMICLLGLSFVTPMSKVIKNAIWLTTVNSRETARVWIDDNLPAGSKVAVESYSPFVDPQRFVVHGVGRMIDHEPEWYVENGFDYLVFGQGMYGRFYRDPKRYGVQISQYESLFSAFTLIKVFVDGNYEVLVYAVR
jgi:4-amino-4-deoxy-L-arabinose transferase-like glycosyltransferase